MLAVVHSLLLYQSLNGVYSDTYHWSVADLIAAVDQSQSTHDATEILTNVYATRCHSKPDTEKMRAFIFRLVREFASDSDVIMDFAFTYFT